MKRILKIDSEYRIIEGEGVEILDTLPPGVYELKAEKMKGFWFETVAMEPFRGKVYGQQRMEEKIIRRYKGISGRNLGVLLSGHKGTGKSLFVRNLSAKMAEEYPVIIVKNNYGKEMLSVLTNVQGRAVIVFDEFEKMFRRIGNDCPDHDNDIREQESVLSFFDGVGAAEEKLFLLTVNNTWDVSEYLMGRPGRIHYHFKTRLPSEEEIKEYLNDNLGEGNHECAAMVASQLAARAVSWDCLAAVVTELNAGESFDDTMEDLNVTAAYRESNLMFTASMSDGSTCRARAEFNSSDTEMHLWLGMELPEYESHFRIKCIFSAADIVPSGMYGHYEVAKFDQKFVYTDKRDEGKPHPEIKKLVFAREGLENYGYFNRGTTLAHLL